MDEKQLQTKSQPPARWWEKPCVHGAALGGSSGLFRAQVYQSPLQAPSWVSTATPLLLPCSPNTSLGGSVAQGLEMPGTRPSPKAAEGESWRPVEERPALENTMQGAQTVGLLLPSQHMPRQWDPPG